MFPTFSEKALITCTLKFQKLTQYHILHCFNLLSSPFQGGAYVLNLFDWQAGGVSLLFLAFFESICIGWLYGTDRLFDNIEFMTGHRPHMWWSLCWKIFSPAVILALFLFSLVEWKGISYGKYKYPDWAEAVGWMLALSSMVCIPLGLLAGIWNGKGSLRQVSDALYVAQIFLHSFS